ncbi:ATP-binding protein [Luteolibacter pohnpeiensis]|uniref:ATP-binding protein n=1 Tax=Luteolibacter pohnpeiensis TaxID=454153 RepID=A0A934S8D0_9BACT|nr:ATP-binding protein [Luteolibacter pohnpeiensis]MBK1884636.1 ATP-binding protein [Luteolibacter pohnpeiensis]
MKRNQNVHTPEEFTEQIGRSLDALIAAAPDGPEEPEATQEEITAVKQCHGWGARYCPSHQNLHGAEWLRTFDEARGAVAKGGIVVFVGNRGPGKTQMAAEIARGCQYPHDAAEWNGVRPVANRTALYRRAIDIFLDLRDANRSGSKTSEKQVLENLARVGLLVIDEFQDRGESDWENRMVTNLIDKRYAAERPTILIANYTRAEMAKAISASVRDRMHENGKSFEFNWPSYRRVLL